MSMLGSNQFTPLMERFEGSYIPEPNSGCWLWTGGASDSSKSSTPDLRPKINVNGKPVTAYRVAYNLFKGDIPADKIICHTCDVSICVNPNHLYAGTYKENAKDCMSRKRHIIFRNPGPTIERIRAIGKRNTWSRGKQLCFAVIPHSDYPILMEMIKNGVTQAEIARKYKVTRMAVNQYLKRRKAEAALLAAKG